MVKKTKEIVDEVVNKLPNTKLFTGKTVIAWFLFSIPLIFSAGIFWQAYSQIPSFSESQWQTMYKNAVLEQPAREKEYNDTIHDLRIADIKLEQTDIRVKENIDNINLNIKEIKSLLIEMSKKSEKKNCVALP